ncbi:MAG: type II secretion system F family protein [Firmicutes bacterium]|nr:type II secretion system F family protein [Bacillota bacterium]
MQLTKKKSKKTEYHRKSGYARMPPLKILRFLEREQCILTGTEGILSALAGAVMMLAAGLFFTKSCLILGICFLLGALIGPVYMNQRKTAKTKELLRIELKTALTHLVIALRAGRSPEGAFEAAITDLDEEMIPHLYPYWMNLLREMDLGYPIEASLKRLADRLKMEEIRSLSKTVAVCKRTDGNLAKVMMHTIRTLEDKMDVEAELRVLLARKRAEQKIMSLMPFAIFLLLYALSPGYMDPLYHTFSGQLVLLSALMLCVIAIYLMRRIGQIEL